MKVMADCKQIVWFYNKNSPNFNSGHRNEHSLTPLAKNSVKFPLILVQIFHFLLTVSRHCHSLRIVVSQKLLLGNIFYMIRTIAWKYVEKSPKLVISQSVLLSSTYLTPSASSQYRKWFLSSCFICKLSHNAEFKKIVSAAAEYRSSIVVSTIFIHMYLYIYISALQHFANITTQKL